LGLPISRSLVQAHGGDLWLESKIGEGTTFFFILPFRPPMTQ
jgi:signal transduction histidine kinase